MKTQGSRVVAVILGAVSVPMAQAQAPLGTGFTYQGQLKQAGVPLNATADFQFSLWDDAGSGDPPTDGNQVRSTLDVTAVNVTNGLFTTELDFGVGAFDGRARWLQIAVRSPAGGGTFTALAPRQALTAAPYAIATLEPSPKAPTSYAGGLLGYSEFQKCVPEDQVEGNACASKAVLSIGLVEGERTVLEAIDLNTPSQRTNIEVAKLARAGSPTPGAYDVEVRWQAPFPSWNTLRVAPDRPVYASWNDPLQTLGFSIQAKLISDQLLQLVIDRTEVHEVTSESEAAIIDDLLYVEPFEPSAKVAQMHVPFLNLGQRRAGYLLTVTNCGPAVAPIPAQWRTAVPGLPIITVTFDIRSSVPFVGGEECTVKLLSPNFLQYDEALVVFPAPTP